VAAPSQGPGVRGSSHLTERADTRPLVLSSGEPAGIGPDICTQLALESFDARLAMLGDPDVFSQRAALLGLDVHLEPRARLAEVLPHRPGTLQVLPVKADAPVTAGKLDPANARYVLRLLELGARLCSRGEGRALVTAPVQKSVINEAGIAFTGHTELLAELTGAALPVMLLVAGTLRVALATTHLPLRRVADAIESTRLERIVEVLHRDLRQRFGIEAPRILVLGLNPHAGERGVLGTEEQTIIEPTIRRLMARGMHVLGPAPADTAFTRDSLSRCDAVLAMYHDQGLPVIKAISFGETVNVTCGLPIVRTSVDHGTALDLAGSGRARADSLRAAVKLALELSAGAA
jgi:4-hydroxythreonine-4-phosphate dehydrogenase